MLPAYLVPSGRNSTVLCKLSSYIFCFPSSSSSSYTISKIAFSSFLVLDGLSTSDRPRSLGYDDDPLMDGLSELDSSVSANCRAFKEY